MSVFRFFEFFVFQLIPYSMCSAMNDKIKSALKKYINK